MKKVAILPAAGRATRLGGLPKFLLPVTEQGESLVGWHVTSLRPHVDEILIPTRFEYVQFLQSLDFGHNVKIFPVQTRTLSETVLASKTLMAGSDVLFGMPDTYFQGDDPYGVLASKPDASFCVATWKTRESQAGKVGSILSSDGEVVKAVDKDISQNFGRHWGALRFNFNYLSLLEPTSETVGDLINEVLAQGKRVNCEDMGGTYFDCGTLSGYKDLLNALD